MTFRRSLLFVLIAATAPPAPAPAQDRDIFDEAERRFAAGNYALAVERFETLLEEFPTSRYVAQAQLRIGQSEFYLGNYEVALERLRRTAVRVQGGPLAATISLWIGLTEFQLADYRDAEEALTAYIENADEPVGRAWLYRGLARRELGRTAGARGDLEIALERTSNGEQRYAAAVLMGLAAASEDFQFVSTVYNRLPVESPQEPYAEVRLRQAADAAWNTGDSSRARQLYTELSEYSLDAAQRAYRRLYAIARDEGNRDRMQSLYREAERRLSGEPERLVDFWYSLGTDALARNRFELAELYLSRIWELRGRRTVDGTVPLYLARALAQQGRRDEALGLLQESLTNESVSPEESTRRRLVAAGLLIEGDRHGEAARIIEEGDAVEVSSDTLYAWAYARFTAGDTESALERLSQNRVEPLLRENPALIRLQARLLLDADEPSDAVRSYRLYLAERPDDTAARLELVRALVAARQFAAVEQELTRIETTPLADARAQEIAYLQGIAAFHREEYAEASRRLTSVQDAAFEPLRSYHLAWSLYRAGEPERARETIQPIVDGLPEDIQNNGRYLLAWTLFRTGRNAAARDQLLRLIGTADETQTERAARSLLATVYLADERYDDALTQYRMLLDAAEGERAAQFRDRIATTLAVAGREQEAVIQYNELASRHPETPAGRNALLEAGELLYGLESLRQSRDRFRDYQDRYPEGEQIDRALFWAGRTSYELDEAGRALLWWEPLINRYPRSEFAPEAMFLSAEAYEARDQRRRALELYDRLTAAYPDSPRSEVADRRRRALRLELDGLSEREADLWVRLQPGGGDTPEQGSGEWFDLVLELARIAIREQITLTAQRSRIVDFLISAAELEGPEAAEATLLLAEYYRRRGETNAAIERYVEAAGTTGATDELRAQALFELAVLARDAGDTETAGEAVEELRRRYGESVWADRAESLTESR